MSPAAKDPAKARYHRATVLVHDELLDAMDEAKGHESMSNYIFRILMKEHGLELEL